MSILSDQHMHSSHSGDCDVPMREMILGAHAAGLTDICFTEHLDYDYPINEDTPEGIFEPDLERYLESYRNERAAAPAGIRVGFGIELGLQPHLGERLRKVVGAYPFDLVLGSAHLYDGLDPYYASFWDGKGLVEEEAVYRLYFESIVDSLDAFHDFDVFAHIDYIVRFGPFKNKYYTYEKYKDLLDRVVDRLLTYNIGLEINTGAIRYGLDMLHPLPELTKRYLAGGGRVITVGADAHKPADIARGFDYALKYLRDCGVREIAVFKEREPHFIQLD